MRWLGLLLTVAACGRFEFERRAPVTGVTLTADNAYVLAVGTGGRITGVVATVTNYVGETEIADCPLGAGPERWSLAGFGPYDELYIFAWDVGDVRGLLAQLETTDGAEPLAMLPFELCADTVDIADPTTAAAAAATMLGACDRSTTAWSHGWVPGVGHGQVGSGVWNGGYPVCPGIFVDPVTWLWWTDGVIAPLVSGDGANAILVRIAVSTP